MFAKANNRLLQQTHRGRQVSFWATEYESGSWTVDPFLTNLYRKEDFAQVVTLSAYECNGWFRTKVLPSGSEDILVQAEHRSMYQSSDEAHSVGIVGHTCMSSSSTAFARNLIRSSWEERIHRAEWDL